MALPSSYDCDSEYVPKYNSTKELTNYWEKNQRQLDQFWEAWRQDYLLTLRETLPLFHKGSRSQITRKLKLGEIVLVSEDNLPHRAWKMAKINKFIFSKDSQIRSVILLPNKQEVSRTTNQLSPLEIPPATDLKVQPAVMETYDQSQRDNSTEVASKECLRELLLLRHVKELWSV